MRKQITRLLIDVLGLIFFQPPVRKIDQPSLQRKTIRNCKNSCE